MGPLFAETKQSRNGTLKSDAVVFAVPIRRDFREDSRRYRNRHRDQAKPISE